MTLSRTWGYDTWGYGTVLGDLVIWTVGGPPPGPPGKGGGRPGTPGGPLCRPGKQRRPFLHRVSTPGEPRQVDRGPAAPDHCLGRPGTPGGPPAQWRRLVEARRELQARNVFFSLALPGSRLTLSPPGRPGLAGGPPADPPRTPSAPASRGAPLFGSAGVQAHS